MATKSGIATGSTDLHSISDFHQRAKAVLPRMAYDYYQSGAGDESGMAENRRAYSRLRLRQSMMRCDIGAVDMNTTVLGSPIRSPICVAPSAYQKMACSEGEAAMARACAGSGTLMTLSSFCNCTLTEIERAAPAEANGCLRWFQMYMPTDRSLTRRMLEQAERFGYKAIALTVDLTRTGIRYANERNKLRLPRHLSLGIFESLGCSLSRDNTIEEAAALCTFPKSWEDVRWLTSATRLPIVVKGVMSSEDALLAIENGASAVWVSNHGGRQLDSAPASMEVLEEIVQCVKGRVEVYVDGGVRNGLDALKALALGARAVFIGRPAVWGLSCDGEAGVRRVLEILNRQLAEGLSCCNCSSVEDIPRAIVVPAAQYRSVL